MRVQIEVLILVAFVLVASAGLLMTCVGDDLPTTRGAR